MNLLQNYKNLNNGVQFDVSFGNIFTGGLRETTTFYYDVVECDNIDLAEQGVDVPYKVIYTGTTTIVVPEGKTILSKTFDCTDIIEVQRWEPNIEGEDRRWSPRVNLINKYFVGLYREPGDIDPYTHIQKYDYQSEISQVYIWQQYGNIKASMSPIDEYYDYEDEETNIPLLAPLVQGNKYGETPELLPRIPYIKSDNIHYPLVCLSSSQYSIDILRLKGFGKLHTLDDFGFVIEPAPPTYMYDISMNTLFDSTEIDETEIKTEDVNDKIIFDSEYSEWQDLGEDDGYKQISMEIPTLETRNYNLRVSLHAYSKRTGDELDEGFVYDERKFIASGLLRIEFFGRFPDMVSSDYIQKWRDYVGDDLDFNFVVEFYNGDDYESRDYSSATYFSANWLVDPNVHWTDYSMIVTMFGPITGRSLLAKLQFTSEFEEKITSKIDSGFNVILEKRDNYTSNLWMYGTTYGFQEELTEGGSLLFKTINPRIIDDFSVVISVRNLGDTITTYDVGLVRRGQNYVEISPYIWSQIKYDYDRGRILDCWITIQSSDMLTTDYKIDLGSADFIWYGDYQKYKMYITISRKEESTGTHTLVSFKLMLVNDDTLKVMNIDLGVDSCLSRYYLCWQDRAGGFQCQPFIKGFTYKEEIKRNEWKTYRNERRIANVNVINKWEIYSDWIEDRIMPYYESIMVSPNVYLWDLEEDQQYKVLVDDNTWTEKTFRNQGGKLNNLKLNLSESTPQFIRY